MEPSGVRPGSLVAPVTTSSAAPAPRAAAPLVPALGPTQVASRTLPDVPRKVLEDPSDPRTIAFVEAQKARTEAVLAAVPLRAAITERVKELGATNPPLRYESAGGQYAIYGGSLTRQDANGIAEMLVNVKSLPPGGVVTDFALSPDGTKVLYGVAQYGDDWTQWRVLDVQSRTVTGGPFTLKNVPPTWDYDSRGIFYNPSTTFERDEHAAPSGEVRYHRLGADPKDDPLVFDDPDKPTASRYLVRATGPDAVYVMRSQGVAEIPLGIRKLERRGDTFSTKMVDMVPPGHDRGRFVHLTDRELFVRTSGAGDNFGIVAVDTVTRKQRVVVQPDPNATLLSAQCIGGKLLLQYMRRDLGNVIRVVGLDGKVEREIGMASLRMPERGTLAPFSGDAGSAKTEFTYQSVACPPETFALDLTTLALKKRPRAATKYDGTKIGDSVHSVTSRDGVTFPIEVYERKDVPASRTFVFQYGAIGIANSSQWNRIFQLMLEMGFRVVLVHSRGGGELGNAWMDSGTFHKQRTLDDISAALHWARAQWPKDKVVLSGRSFGGMHTLNRLLADPDGADAFMAVAPVSDAESFLLRQSGWWARDDFAFRRDAHGFLLRNDPLPLWRMRGWNPMRLLARARQIKPVMIFTANHDTRVGPQQTYVMTDALQRKFGEQVPIYMTQYVGGHTARAELPDMATYLAGLFGITKLSPTTPPGP